MEDMTSYVPVRCDGVKNYMKQRYETINITIICKIYMTNIINITQIILIIVGASPEMPLGKLEMRCLSGVGLGRVVTASPA
jgi:hypothetical protein